MMPTPNKLSTQDHLNCIELYNSGYNCRKIAKLYGVSHTSIRHNLIKRGVKIKERSLACRRYPCNDNFFDKIDNEETAYFFGLFYADGCNYPDKNSVSICLMPEDKHILEHASLLIQPTKPLSCSRLSLRNSKWKDTYIMTITSKHMSTILSDYGMVPRKSLVKVFPEMILNSNEDIIRHFIRGYFDGNGSISTSRNYSGYSIDICSTYDMCKTIGELLKKYLGIRYLIRNVNNPDSNTYRIGINSGEQMCKVCEWLYKDASLFLHRKHDKYIEYKFRYEEHIINKQNK